uniref:Putative ovule protein n=1 Tax=Solanum chacoense TaxID=4108 RepID=A0A0V0H057_SOLCH
MLLCFVLLSSCGCDAVALHFWPVCDFKLYMFEQIFGLGVSLISLRTSSWLIKLRTAYLSVNSDICFV